MKRRASVIRHSALTARRGRPPLPALLLGFAMVLAVGLMLAHAAPAAAAESPHSSYAVETAKCASCHSTQTAYGPTITRAASTRALCLSCHNGAQATDVQTAFTASANPLAQHDVMVDKPADIGVTCTSCHAPHRTSDQYRHINPDQPTVLQGSALATTIEAGQVFVLVGAEHDGHAPVISGLTIDSAADGTAPVIRWTTDEFASSWIDWGLTTAYELGNETTGTPLGNAVPVTTHMLQFSGLTPGVTYHLRIRSADAAGNSSVSGDQAYTAYETPPWEFAAVLSVASTDTVGGATVLSSAETTPTSLTESSTVTWLYPHTVPPGVSEYSVDTDRIVLRLSAAGAEVRDIAPAAGWESSGAVGARPVPAAPGAPAGGGWLQSVSAVDRQYWRTALASADREWDWQVMRFDLGSAEIRSVQNLAVMWTGHGEATIGYATVVYVWDAVDGWTQVAGRQMGTDTAVSSVRGAVSESFCLACHDGSGAGSVTMPGTVTNLGATWPADLHGTGQSAGFGASPLATPYARQSGAVPCSVCHSTHGSASIYHVPAEVNGTTGISATNGAELRTLCTACHTGALADWHRPCVDCHSGGHWAGWVDPPVENYLPTEASDCTTCHGHGKSWTHQATCLKCHGAGELQALGATPDQPWTYPHTF